MAAGFRKRQLIYLVGASGYVGQAFQTELRRRGLSFRAIERTELDCSNFIMLREALRTERPTLLINAAGVTGKPNVDACEARISQTILGNVILPQRIAQACESTGIRFGHVSSGCIYNGAKIRGESGVWKICQDLNDPEISAMLAAHSNNIKGFEETDAPNFTFASGKCSVYSGSKALAERVLEVFPEAYIWRLRMPFEYRDSPRNFLTKIQRYGRVYQNWNSLSCLQDFVSACLDSWELGLAGGTYNIVNPGYVSTREVVELIQRKLRPDWLPQFWKNDVEFYREAAKAPRSNCLLESTKLVCAGVKMPRLEEALEKALSTWKTEGEIANQLPISPEVPSVSAQVTWSPQLG
jgi:dTDP-4-dehydrorhamnose reductase